MGMRLGSVRLFAALLLTCMPAVITAAIPRIASAATTPQATPQKATAKAAVKKAKKARKTQYAAPIYTSIVLDADTGRVLHETNADRKSYPASLTKMMTLYLTFEGLERGEVSMDTKLKVSQHAAAAAPSKLGLTPKMSITVEQAINALITKSANDVAVVLAERLGGSESRFAEKMTAKARALGMSNTTFYNPHGLPHPKQFSTARDMATLGIRLMKDFPQYYPLFSQMSFTYAGQTIRTHNRLLEFYDGADGIKTGYTAASGFNLVASATRNGHRVIGVVFGGKSSGTRDRQLAGLMDGGFSLLTGQPETLVATQPQPFETNLQTAQATEEVAVESTSAGDQDEAYITPGSTIETTAVPPLLSNSGAEAPATTIAALIPRATAATSKAPATKPSTAGTWGIQIGAFASVGTAATQSEAAASRLRTTFGSAQALVLPVTTKGRTIYRARIMGLSEKDLLKACGMVKVQAKSACQAVTPQMARVAAR